MFGFAAGVAERSEQVDSDRQAAGSVALGREFEVADAGFLLTVTLPAALKVAALLVDWVCCSVEEWVSRFLVKIPRLGDHHPPY